jgi:hypothetical protein
MSTKKVTKKELAEKAVGLGLRGISKLRKLELIHSIQVAEGNTDCFSRILNCAVTPCLYQAECQS